ncbi:hypothetical protein GGI21_005744, partial [Coemansia aciculifera]
MLSPARNTGVNNHDDDDNSSSSEQIELTPQTQSTLSLSAAPTINCDETGKAGLASPVSSSSCSKTLPRPHYDEEATYIEEEKKRPISHIRRRFIFVGLFFTIFLSGLDQTVTSTILTHIANDFKALDRIDWVPTIFMLCSTCLNILSGRIADVFDRASVLLFSLAAFVIGAVLSAFAQSIVMFIVARGISGIGCGGMLSLSIIIISDI